MKLEGFAFTEAGWVQSYGSRYVRPPIIHGDVVRKGPMTIKEFEYAQSLTKLPVKGMLTGARARSSQARQCRQWNVSESCFCFGPVQGLRTHEHVHSKSEA